MNSDFGRFFCYNLDMKKIIVKAQAAKRLKNGYPLIVAEDLVEEGVLEGFVAIYDQKQQFIGKGYLSKQNKGMGWLLTNRDEPINQAFYEEKFEKAKTIRDSFFSDQQTNAFRLFNGEGDGIGGLTVDFYANYAVFSWYNPFIYLNKLEILTAFSNIYPEICGIYEKIRFSNQDNIESQFVSGQRASEPLIVTENGVHYATYLDKGLMTGIFLDQKNVRGALADGLAAGKRMLNMFSYTGAFSVASAFGGSIQTTSVDLAKRSLEKTSEQFSVNDIDPATQKIYVMDVFGYFGYAKKKELTYDLIVLDPPSFSRNGKKTFSVAKNYGELVEDAIDILDDFGILICSTNAANVSRKKFHQLVSSALTKKNVHFDIFQEEHLPKDFHVAETFPEGDYLKVLFVKIRK
ncbi:SAM-dependent methyltransferase [Lactococcus fujiensis JCM 16395]|uniref:SAM-dependent methyltransferase n=2 Tax=Lactococcus fujiensis TaxID=610251 RepID=A0A2A5RKX3_9LACT|nr:SAM-dependent methyltransferase [Lactococcus fujiensis JCM 16395]